MMNVISDSATLL